jgi:hypothetical protein
MKYLMIEGRREAYGPDKLRTMTVGELILYLEQFDEDELVILSNDNGYTYGSITGSSFEEARFDEYGNREDDEDED